MLTKEYFAWLVSPELGYRDPRRIGDGRCAFIMPKIYTHAIVTARIGDMVGWDDCWCYPTYDDAKAALDVWNGTGEPEGWIRHPDSGRRVAMHDGERDEQGQVVERGSVYVRF
jgi:hypothetical protein